MGRFLFKVINLALYPVIYGAYFGADLINKLRRYLSE